MESDKHKQSAASTTGLDTTKILAIVILAIVVGVGGFVGGMQYQKGKTTTNTNQTTGSNFGQTGTRRGFNRNGSFGVVTAISASSISVQERRTGTVKTYDITSATSITSAGAAATASSIAVGDNAIISASSATSTTATSIAINPTMGAGGGMPGGTAPTDPTASTN